MKPLRPLLKWFGSSWASAKHYPAPLPGLPIFEPFCGGAGYSLNHYTHDVTIWDTNVSLRGLWEWLINEATSEDVLSIPLNLPEGTDIRTLDLSEGQKQLLKHWQRTNNVGPCMTISKWGSKPGQWTENTRTRVAEQVNSIKHWKFEEPTWDVPGTYFIDPPYQYNYQYGVKSFDYDKLVCQINQIPKGSLVIASEAVCSKTGRIPDYLPFQPSHSQVTSRRKTTNNHHSKELVFIRYT
jgi:hypothetical protein